MHIRAQEIKVTFIFCTRDKRLATVSEAKAKTVSGVVKYNFQGAVPVKKCSLKSSCVL